MSYVVDAACKRGVAAYLAEQHSAFRGRSLSMATLTGAVGSGVLYGADRFMNLDLEWWQIGIPMMVTIVAGLGVGAFKAESYDAENIEAFKTVCNRKED